MDVPYDPACPLLIDSDNESFISDDGDIEKKVDDVWSKKMELYNRSISGGAPTKETKVAQAFEDDNDELLNYCLKESGFLSDTEMKEAEDVAHDTDLLGEINVETEDKDIMGMTEDKEDKEKIDGFDAKKRKGKNKEKERKEKSHKKKKKKHDSREKHKEKKNRDSSLEHGISKKKKESLKPSKEEKNIKIKKEEREKDRKEKSKQKDFKHDSDDDDDDIFANLGLEDENDVFPLSKTENVSLGGNENLKEKFDENRDIKTKKVDEEKSRRKSRKRKMEHSSLGSDDDKNRKSDEGKKSKKKRKRSKSSQRKSVSTESDEAERKKKWKKKKKERSTERDKGKHLKMKSDDMSDRKKRKIGSDMEDERNQKHRRKEKRKFDRKDEKKFANEGRDQKYRKESERSTHRKPYSEKDENGKSERRRQHKIHSKSKERDKKHERSSEKEKGRKESETVDKKINHFSSEAKDGAHRIDRKLKEVKLDATLLKSGDSNCNDKKKSAESAAKETEIVFNHNEIERKPMEGNDSALINSDTDSEFERLSDIEKENEMSSESSEKVLPSDKLLEDEDKGKNDTLMDEKSGASGKMIENIDKNLAEVNEKRNVLDKVICDTKDEENENLATEINVDMGALNSDESKSSSNLSSSKDNDLKNDKILINEKRPFKLFSKEETKKLEEELLSKDDESKSKDDEQNEKEDEEDIKEEMEVERTNDDDEVQSETEEVKNEKIDIFEEQNAQKSKDDLFDDIFSKEDPETGDDNDIAKMYGKFEDTSPKKEFFKKHKITTSSDRKGLEASEERSPKKTPKLKLEGGKYNGRKTKSPKIKSHQESVIPGLEEVQIPGLESNKERKEKSKEFDVNVSKIPLLFDDESVNTTKHDGIPKTPELSPSKERNVRKKQPYTPPEDFTDEIGNNELNNDSPYNPEDLTPMDMGLSPIDANLIQQEALKGAVELKLKEPFSGFENPTWQKIIEAKSKHEAKRQKYKEYESSEKADEINSKDDSKSWKQEKLVNMLVRQSRVEQECKEVLKTYYKSKEITKEEYKNILRKAVPQVTMSNSPIIPEKIRSLMKKFVCKCKGQRLMTGNEKSEKRKGRVKHKSASLSQTLTFPGEKRFRYLNPDLPMPPV